MNSNNITYRQQYSFCSKPGCRKCREGIGHGPYWYASQVVKGRTVRTYIGKTLPAGVRAEQIVTASRAPSPATADVLAPSFRLTTLGMLRLESRAGDEGWQTVSETGWRLPQARALLGCLLCAPNRRLTLQRAGELLWPELDAKSAAQNVRRAGTALGQVFGQIYSRQAGNVLALAGQAQLWVDCEAFEELLAQARALPATERARRVSLLEQAMKLYGGDFFPEERAASWSQGRRDELRRRWLRAILELADLYIDEQHAGAAIDLLSQVAASEPAHEAAVQRLMFLLARQQRRVEAVQTYQRLVTSLHNTSQAAPSPETQKLFFAIQQGNEELLWPLAAANTPDETSRAGEEAEMRAKQKGRKPTSTNEGEQGADQQASASETTGQAVSEISIGRANQSPLVGRELEVNSLYRLLTEVELLKSRQAVESEEARFLPGTPRAHCVVLMGEPGIGKTRLAEESAREARRRGWTVVWSRAYQQEQGIPYRIWTAALRNILTYMPELALQTTEFASAVTYQPLRALLPEMQEALAGASGVSGSEMAAYESLSPEQEELRLREAVSTFLTTLSFTSPLLIVLDDIQWIDDSSAQMLGYLARRMNEHPIVLLATCRETDLALHRVLNGLIAHMQREQVVELIDVQPLSNEDIKELVSYLPAPAITQIQNQVAGNPFFAEELAYSLQTSSVSETALLADSQQEAQILPGTIAAALNQRLTRLSSECQNLLSRAAVLGRSFDFDLIAAMGFGGPAGDDDTVLDLLDEALHAGVLTEEGRGAHVTYHFWHPLLASHLYNGLTATRRAFLHRKIAEALRQIHQARESEEAATITQHLLRGGAEPARVAHYAELAAQRAYSLFAYSDAERYYRLALEYLAPALLDSQSRVPRDQPLLPEKPLEQRLHLAFLMERLAECTRVRGNFQDAPAFYQRAIQLRIREPQAFATPEEARQEAQIQAMLWSEIAWIWRFTGDSAAAHDCNERGEETLRKAGITDGPAWGCLRHQQANLYWLEGYHQEALQAEHQALDLFTACLARSASDSIHQSSIPATRQTRTTRTLQGDPVDLGRAHAFLGIYYAAIGQLSEALKHLHEALAIYEQHDRRREVGHVCCNIGHVYLLKADYTRAERFFQRPQSYVEQSGDIPLKSVLLYNMGELAATARRFDEAEKCYREGLALATQMNDREYLSTWNAILGTLLQEQGRFKEAAAFIRRALAIGRANPPNQPCIGFALVALAQLRCALVESERAAESARGRHALRKAEIDLARALSQRGLEVEKRTQAELVQAQVARLLGNFSLARQLLQQASSNAQRYELQAIHDRCQHLLAELPIE
jgi:DNA-binding SARP family transcriptional activator/tetratricopeptide (TPR) repeat protein